MIINNINQYNDLELALMVLLGYLGNGTERKKKLGARYKEVQNLVNIMIDTKVMPKSNSIDDEAIEEALFKMEPTHQDYIDYIYDFISNLKGGMRK